VLHGSHFIKDGEPCFPPASALNTAITGKNPHSPDGVFRTVFAGVPHTGITYCKCNPCVRLATRRLTNCRNATLPATADLPKRINPNALAEENAMLSLQTEFIDDHPDIITFLSEWFSQKPNSYTDAKVEAWDHAGDTHAKRMLRIQALTDAVLDGTFPDRHWGETPTWKMKTIELAKHGKLPRMIGDLGVAASLLGFRVTAVLKEAMAHQDGFYHGAQFRFVKAPKTHLLRAVFQDLMDPQEAYFLAIFSDDSCLSVRDGGQVNMYNMDISSCDASHSARLFQLLIDTAPPELKDDVRVLVEQCSGKLRLLDCNNKRNHILYRLLRPRLLSGSTLTTHINNCANVLIGASIALRKATTPTQIIAAAHAVGYQVTLDYCPTYHTLQFLKHSPCYDTSGVLQPVLNVGVFLRSFGTCHGDLPGRGPLRPRADEFQRALLQGMYPRLDTPVLTALRTLYGSAPVSTKMLLFANAHHAGKTDIEDTTVCTIDTTELLHRYALIDLETSELEECFARWCYQTSVECPAFAKILQLDYGLTTVTEDW